MLQRDKIYKTSLRFSTSTKLSPKNRTTLMRARKIQRFPAGPSPWPILRAILNRIDWGPGLPHLGTPMPPIQNAALSLRKDLACVTHFKRDSTDRSPVYPLRKSGQQANQFPGAHVRGFDVLVAVDFDFEISPFPIEANLRSRHDLAGAPGHCRQVLPGDSRRASRCCVRADRTPQKASCGRPREADFQLVLLIRRKGSVDRKSPGVP